jgi:hypothetical protein
MARLAAVATLIVGLSVHSPTVASAAIALAEAGTVATGGGTTITPTLPSATTSGDLLVGAIEDVNSGCTTDTFSAPSGWVKAAHVCRGTTGPIEIWYHPNIAAGTTSVAFGTGSNGANTVAQLSEWSGVDKSSPLDRSGTNSSSSSTTSLSVATSGVLSASNEFSVDAFETAAGLTSFTPASGWTSLNSDPGGGFDSNYDLTPASGAALTGGVTSAPGTTWGGAIATFYGACGGGSLGLTAPATTTLTAITLNGTDQSATTNVAFTPADSTGSASGWNLTGTSTTFQNASSKTLPATATTITGGSVAAVAGTCRLPTNSITYPVTLPAAASAPAAVKLYDAAAATGLGSSTVTLTFKLSVPPSAFKGTYTSTWTFSLVSGP